MAGNDYDYQRDAEPEAPPPPAQNATMHPALQAFQDAIPADTGAKPWATEVSTRLNNWSQMRDLADANQEAGNEYVRNFDEFKSGLKSMVQVDPTSVHTALDIVPPTVHALIPSAHPEETYDDTHSALTQHIQNEIAHTAVTSMAERSAGAARGMLGDPRIDGLLSDDDKLGLQGYITAQSLARGADFNAQQKSLAADQSRGQNATMHNYASALLNQGTGEVSFPNGWAQRMIADQGMRPEDKSALMNLYGRLQTAGDAPESDGNVVRNALNQMKAGTLSSSDIFNAVGHGPATGLSMKDALWLNGLMHSEDTAGKVERGNFTDTLNKAAEKLMGPAGENGAAGQRNYNNFAKWLVGAYQGTGAGSLNPGSDSYLFKNTGMNAFQDPTPTVLNGRDEIVPQRPIGHFFGRRRR